MKLNKQGIRDLGNPNPRRPLIHEHEFITIEDESSETQKSWPVQVEQCQFCPYRVVTRLY